jgi:porin
MRTGRDASATTGGAARSIAAEALFAAAALTFGLSGPVWAQTDPGSSAGTESQSSELDSGEPEDDGPESADALEGPSSVSGQLQKDRKATRVFGPQILKDRLQSRYGLALGVDYNVLAQQISQSPGESGGVGGVARAYGRWDLVGRARDPDVGSLVFKVEYRHSIGTELPPNEILSTAGVAGISGPTFSAAGGVLTNLFWTQAFADDRVSFIAGVVDPTDYVDVYALVNPWTDFNNLAFSTSPTIPVPNQGLGAAARWSLTSHAYVLGGLSDANADPHRPGDFVSSFAEGEYFKHLEFGLLRSWATRMSHNIHVLLWQVDDRKEAGVEGGWGATFSWSTELDNGLVPFLRGGYSDSGGILVDRSISAGVGYTLGERGNFVGVGANWGRAPDVDRNQYQLETFYRTFITRGLSVIPSVQYIRDPAYDPSVSNLWLLALRLRAVW